LPLSLRENKFSVYYSVLLASQADGFARAVLPLFQ
jgi:hypothetical protein